MHRFTLRRARYCVIGLAVLAMACSKGDKNAKSDSMAAVAPTTDSSVALAAMSGRGKNQMPGALTKPIDSYTGDEFHQFTKRLSYGGGHERERKCKDDPACESQNGLRPAKRTLVLVDAVAKQDSLALPDIPEHGVVYVRAINKGTEEEAVYNLKPGKQYEYYMIVVRDAAGAARWRLEELDTTPNARRHTQIGSGPFTSCNHTWKPGANADFKTCAEAAAGDSVVKMGLLLQGPITPVWSACAYGCCTMSL